MLGLLAMTEEECDAEEREMVDASNTGVRSHFTITRTIETASATGGDWGSTYIAGKMTNIK